MIRGAFRVLLALVLVGLAVRLGLGSVAETCERRVPPWQSAECPR